MRRTRARLNHEDGIVCHRAGYVHVSPQLCLEKHTKNEDLCGTCTWHRVACDVMCAAGDLDPDRLYTLAREGVINQIANPLIRPESLPDPATNAAVEDDNEKGPKNVNTRILFINGRRMPQGMVADFRVAGTLAERSMTIFFLRQAIEKIEVKDVAVDEYVNGRLQTRFEWSASDDKKFGPPMNLKLQKNGKDVDVIGFRVAPENIDGFSRG